MDVLGSIKIGRTTSTDTIAAEYLNRTVFQKVVSNEVVEIIGGKIADCTPVGKPHLRADGSAE